MTRPCSPGSVLAIALIVAGACTSAVRPAARNASSASTPGWDASRLDPLVRLGREDQAGRESLARAMVAQDTATLFASMRTDSARTRWVRAAIGRHGWPLRAAAGDSAVQAAWLILQHTPDTAWQAAMLPELERLARTGELQPAGVAMLMDRVLVQRKQPQRYGSQFSVVNGRLVPDPIDDLARLDARRGSVGLQPMAEYVRLLAEQTGLPVVWPPGL